MSTRRGDSSLAALLLSQRLVEAPADPLKASEYWAVLAQVGDPTVVLSGVAAIESCGVLAEMAKRLDVRCQAAAALAFELERLETQGIIALTSIDEGYPARLIERLGANAPPALYVAGSSELLSRAGLGIVGSRDVHPAAAEVSQEAARLAARVGLAVVSGAAKGVDQLAMGAALEAGGEVIGMVADSLVRRIREGDTRRALLEGVLVVATPYAPSAGFSVGNAMGRNKLIYALSDATFVVASDLESGGTWAGATEALRAGTCEVAVWSGPGAGPGNAALIAHGAREVPDLDALLPLGVPAVGRPPDPANQLRLDL